MPRDEADLLLTALFDAVELRAGCRGGPADCTRQAVGALGRAADSFPELVPVARLAIAPLSARVRADAAEVLAGVRGDPAAPGLEVAYACVVSELSKLATAFTSAAGAAGARVVPDPADEHADEYTAVCVLIRDLMAAAAPAQPVWRLLRASRAAARARPPGRRQGAPLADDREYYTLARRHELEQRGEPVWPKT
jgi:hypothetical protein